MSLATVLASGDAGATVIDTGIVTELVNLVKTVMGLFSEFPLNVILIASLCGVAFALFRKAKKSAHA